MRRLGIILFATVALLGSLAGHAAELGPAGLRARFAALRGELARNALGAPLHLESAEAPRRIEGDMYAVVDQPFATTAKVLGDPGQWCDILILHLNNKYCRRSLQQGPTTIDLRVGKKQEQAVADASLLHFVWEPPKMQTDYLRVRMTAADGPYDTRDYAILVEAVPLEGDRTFLHLGYAFGYGGASHFALHLYLATVGRDKVGFSRTGEGSYVGGMRGVAERNLMRYYLAIEAYLHSLAAPPPRQLDARLEAWFDATERYPRQLHELDRADYLRMKQSEVRRMAAR